MGTNWFETTKTNFFNKFLRNSILNQFKKFFSLRIKTLKTIYDIETIPEYTYT